MSLFCVLISLQSSEEEEGCLCEDAGLEKGHVETGLSEVVVGPLLGEMPLIPENTPGKAKLCIVPPPPNHIQCWLEIPQ